MCSPRRHPLQQVPNLTPLAATPDTNTNHSQAKRRLWGRSQHGGMCMPTVLHVPSGRGACLCLLLKSKEGWAVVEQSLPMLGHQLPSCSLASLHSTFIHLAVMLHSAQTLRLGGKLCKEELFAAVPSK